MEATVSATPVEHIARWLKLLADENRLRILYLLQEEHELNVRSLCERLQQSQPAVSHHLALLRAQGVLTCRRDGKHNYYSIAEQHPQSLLAQVLRSLRLDAQSIIDAGTSPLL